jgi:hypothetical protein
MKESTIGNCIIFGFLSAVVIAGIFHDGSPGWAWAYAIMIVFHFE